ncbi:Rid family hydrolase [Anaerovibrio sp.]|uniref:RidA family protein n=1 Tax=Anaerovibrio sp. TaxID=1872532 RepID=UPI0025B8DE93|nr:Rid family hydrolase [Anaerovibrio sp.]MBR2142750.1 hypothetical protein [Anaerovibrio sp.]
MKSIIIDSKLENKGHYVPGVISKGMLYISGQLPVHHETGAPLADNITQQTLDALHNVELVLDAAGLKKENITSFKMSPSSLGGGKQTTTAGEHISQLVETLIGRFFF